ncbi:unnamed protein product [Protopolystoma xenopodis]|uniref:Uncharacterized protein n=1 Tax=Protopolystoma xenopodis TaxID=117903 RepID=A0A3S5B3X6_9PLAT|nr:unnamed protein product [Protopolystoma xenopodis]
MSPLSPQPPTLIPLCAHLLACVHAASAASQTCISPVSARRDFVCVCVLLCLCCPTNPAFCRHVAKSPVVRLLPAVNGSLRLGDDTATLEAASSNRGLRIRGCPDLGSRISDRGSRIADPRRRNWDFEILNSLELEPLFRYFDDRISDPSNR